MLIRCSASNPTCLPRSRAAWLLITLILLPLAPPAARAQETREHELPKLEKQLGGKKLVRARFDVSNRFIAKADFGEFEAASYQPEIRFRVSVPVSRRVGIQLWTRGRILVYDFDGQADIGDGPSDAPFDNLNSWTVRLQGAYLLDESWTLFSDRERWSVFGELATRSRWETGSTVGDGLRYGGSVGFGYRLGDDFDLVLGVSVANKLDGGVRVAPLAEFGWRINDRWSLNSVGLGLELDRELSPRIRAFLRARLEGGNYRLADRGGSVGAGSLRVRQLPVAVGLRWKAFKHFHFRAAVGLVAYQQMRLRNSDGDTLGSREADPSAYVMLRIDMKP